MRVRLSPRRLVDAARARAGRGQVGGEDGFSLVEAIVGLTLIFSSLLLLFGALNTGIRGLLTGRQRLTATAVAEQEMENIRRACYERVGHSFSDPTLSSATDPDLRQASGVWYYEPQGVSGFSEKLVQATTSADCTGSAVVPTHTLSGTRDGTPYDVWVYVTEVVPTAGNGLPHKRLTVVARLGNQQYGDSAVDRHVRLSSLVFDGEGIPGTGGAGGGTSQFPIVTGDATADAGSFTFSGSLRSVTGGSTSSVQSSTVTFPYGFGFLRQFLVDEGNGLAKSQRFTMTDSSSPTPPAGCTSSGGTITCPEASASTSVDGDGGTALPYSDSQTASTASKSFSAGLLSVTTGAGTVTSGATVCGNACTPYTPPVTDTLPYQEHEGVGADAFRIGFDLGSSGGPVPGNVKGSIIKVGGDAKAKAQVDQNPVAGKRKTKNTATNTYPSITLLSLDAVDLLGSGIGATVNVVSIDAFSVNTVGEIGPTGSGASCNGGAAINVTVLGPVGLTVVPITPCTDAIDQSYSTPVLSIVDPSGQQIATANATVRIVATRWVETEQTDATGEFKLAKAQLDDWLRIIVTLDMTVPDGPDADSAPDVVADIDGTMNYGDLVAYAERTP